MAPKQYLPAGSAGTHATARLSQYSGWIYLKLEINLPGESPHLQQVDHSPSANHKDFAAVEANPNFLNKSLQPCVADLLFWIWWWCQDCLNPPCGYWLPCTCTDEFPHRHARNKCIASQSTTFGKICQAQTQKNPYYKKPYYTGLPLTEHQEAQEVPSIFFFILFIYLFWGRGGISFSEYFLCWVLWLNPGVPET